VQADVTVSAAGAGAFVQLRYTSIGGNFTVDAGSNTESVQVALGNSSGFEIGGPVTIAGDVAITTGTGEDTIFTSDTLIGGATSIATGGGNDTIILESGGFAGPSQFFGAVTVTAGGGKDGVQVGSDDANAARFYAAVTFDGGSGSNTLTETAPRYYGGVPARIGFPTSNG
jgi:hypothetical protein